MFAFFGKRILILIATLLLVSGMIFLVLKVIPGDPAQIILGVQATPENLTELRHKLGLDQPLTVQYWNWLSALVRGDFGRSITYDVPISALIVSRLTVTIPLAILSIFFAVVLSVPLGIYAATHRNQPGDYGVMVFSQIGLAIPAFWAGILLILFFAVHLQWFSAGGFKSWTETPLGALKSLLLPALSLGLIRAAVLARLTRSCMLEALGEDYIRTARSKGLAETIVVYKHALRNALIPVVTIIGLQMGELLAGAIVIENVFNLPGLGRLVFLAIGQRDLPVVQGVSLLIAFFIVMVNFGVDVLYGVVDPRIRLGYGKELRG
ncbi:MAG: ABC transporter permease [Thermodesulfobacteriota bacterium]|nr:ABC transporter permease [Thermodesulfobacteriota bacterium]